MSKLSLAIAITLLPGILTPASACLWDRDTLAAEASGYHDTIAVITGRFPRNPAVFYEHRLARVEKELAHTPDNLALYDDAGVACDRLHRSAEAIAWMDKKAIALQANPNNEHLYRYHANLGTFLIHQWLAEGADLQQPEGKQGRGHIAQAIELNPDAHFGREIVQLMAIDWIIERRQLDGRDKDGFNSLLEISGSHKEPLPNSLTYDKAITGLSGLVSLGAAWESVDVFHALADALNANGHASISYLANLRAIELLASGKKSFLPVFKNAPVSVSDVRVQSTEPLESWYKEARKAANKWHDARTAYIEKRVGLGEHPDTFKQFWEGFDSDSHQLPRIPGEGFHSSVNLLVSFLQKLSLPILLLIGAIGIALLITKKIRRGATNEHNS